MNRTLAASIRSALRSSGWAVMASAMLVTYAGAREPTDAEARAAATEAVRTATSAQLYASPAQVRMVQQKLKEHGRKLGDVDGVWGENTSAEVRDYQKANGLAPTGQLDTSLLSALQIGNVLEGQAPSRAFLDGLLQGESGKAGIDPTAPSGAPIFVSPEHLAQIQYLLRDEGFYAGPIDGAWGDATAQAANKYRQAQGLEVHDGVDVALLQSLNRQGKEMPKLASNVASRTSGMPLEAGPAAIRALQRELSQSGHEAGDIDGVWGENTRQALRQFQRRNDLEATGTLTLPTLAALGLDVANKAHSAIEAQAQRDREKMREEEQDALAETDPKD